MNDVVSKSSDSEVNPSNSWTILSDSVECRKQDGCTLPDLDVIRLPEHEPFEKGICEKPVEECDNNVTFPQIQKKVWLQRRSQHIQIACIAGTILALLVTFLLALLIPNGTNIKNNMGARVGENCTKIAVRKEYPGSIGQNNSARILNSKNSFVTSCPKVTYGPPPMVQTLRKTPRENVQKLSKPPVDVRSKKMPFTHELHTKGLIVTKETLKDLLCSIYLTNFFMAVQEIILSILVTYVLFTKFRDEYRKHSIEHRINALKKIRKTIKKDNLSTCKLMDKLSLNSSCVETIQQYSVLEKSNKKQLDYLEKLKLEHEERMERLRSNRHRQQEAIETLICAQKQINEANSLNDEQRSKSNNPQMECNDLKGLCYKSLASYWSKREEYLTQKVKFIEQISKSVKEIMGTVVSASTEENGKCALDNILNNAILVFSESEQLEKLRSTLSHTNFNHNFSSTDLASASEDEGSRRCTVTCGQGAMIKNNDIYSSLFGRKGNEIRKRDISFWRSNARSRIVDGQSHLKRSSRSRKQRRRMKVK